jgi:hypothetical protein
MRFWAREVGVDPGIIVGLAVGLVIGIILLFVLGLILQWLWNSTLPDVINVKRVTTWQAIKIMFIASILFGGHRVVTVDEAVTNADAVEQPAAIE